MPTPSNPSSRSSTPIKNLNPNPNPTPELNTDSISLPSHIEQEYQPPSRSSSLRANQRSDRLKEKTMAMATAGVEQSGSDGAVKGVKRKSEESTGISNPIPGPKPTSSGESEWSLRPDETDEDPSTFSTPPETPDHTQLGRSGTSASASASEDSHESGSKWEVGTGMGVGMGKGKGKGKDKAREGVRVAKRVEVRTEVGVLATFGEGTKA